MIYNLKKVQFMSNDFWLGAKFGKGNFLQRLLIIRKIRGGK